MGNFASHRTANYETNGMQSYLNHEISATLQSGPCQRVPHEPIDMNSSPQVSCKLGRGDHSHLFYLPTTPDPRDAGWQAPRMQSLYTKQSTSQLLASWTKQYPAPLKLPARAIIVIACGCSTVYDIIYECYCLSTTIES